MLLLLLFVGVLAQEPNPPVWPSNVYVFDPATPSTTQAAVNKVFSENGGTNPAFNGQFSNDRYAFLFKPGTHNVNVNVGFYTSVIGTGAQPNDTHIQTVTCNNGDTDYTGGALCNFWRSAENFYTKPSGSMTWAVSQAAPLRRVTVDGNLALSQSNGYSSGGYLGDSVVTGTITSGTQQQWLTRNTRMGSWSGANWNMVFVGNSGGVPGTHCGTSGGGPYTTVSSTPVIAEKPYIAIDSSGKYTLRIPKLESNKVGPTTNFDNVDVVDFSSVFVATQSNTAAQINDKLNAGLHVVLSPGNYNLDGSITVNKTGQVVLGIGFPTLIPTAGKPAIVVGNVDGARIGGILLQAGKTTSPTLLQWGSTGYAGNANNPGFLHDVFARVGGPNNPSQYQVSANIMVQINSGHVVYDNSWLWRADHDVSGEVKNSDNPVHTGLQVNGANVITYGLAAEHTLQDLVQWNGENGQTYFYQSELPYDVTEANFGTPGYVGYRVNNSVQAHQCYGAGVYCYFRDYAVTTANGIMTGTSTNLKFTNSFTVYLSGQGQISHVIDNKGGAVTGSQRTQYICSLNEEPSEAKEEPSFMTRTRETH